MLLFSLMSDVFQILKSKITYQKLSFIVAVIPALLLGVMLMQKTVNVPFYDQWELVPKIENLQQGNFLVDDLWQQHNEHRLFFPRLLMLGSAVLTDWNTNYEILISFILAIASFVLLIKTLQTTNRRGLAIPFLLPLVLSVIWFSPVQSENWMWGWQIQWFLSVLGVVCCLYGLAQYIDKKQKRAWADFPLLILGGVIAQYSLGNGILIWPLLIVALIFLEAPKIKIYITSAVALITTGIHYFTQIEMAPVASRSLFLKEPVDFAQYISTYLGRPLSYLGKLTPILGVFLVATFFFLGIFLFIKHRDRFKSATPWFVLGLYACGSALVTAVSRLGLGVATAYTSRYTTISSLLLIAVVIIIATNLDLIKLKSKRFKNLLIQTATLSLLGLLLMNARWGYNWATVQSQYLTDIRNCTHAEEPYEVCLLSAYPDKVKAKNRIEYMKSIKWGGY